MSENTLRKILIYVLALVAPASSFVSYWLFAFYAEMINYRDVNSLLPIPYWQLVICFLPIVAFFWILKLYVNPKPIRTSSLIAALVGIAGSPFPIYYFYAFAHYVK